MNVKILRFEEPLVLKNHEDKTVQTIVGLDQSAGASVRICSLSSIESDGAQEWVQHVSASLVPGGEDADARRPEEFLTTALGEVVNLADFAHGLGSTPPADHPLRRLWSGDGRVVAQLRLPDSHQFDAERYLLPPSLLSACFEAILPLLPGWLDEETAWVPVAVERVSLARRPGQDVWCEARVKAPAKEAVIDGPSATRVDLHLFTPDGELVAALQGVQLRRITRSLLFGLAQETGPSFYRLCWEPASGRPAADVLTDPSDIAARLRPLVASLAADPQIRCVASAYDALNQRAAGYVVCALTEADADASAGRPFSLQKAAQTIGVTERNRRLWGRLCEILRGAGILQGDGDLCVLAPASSAELGNLDDLLARYPTIRAEVMLLDRCGPHLRDVLAGRCDPLDLIFRGGDLGLSSQFYEGSPAAQAMNRLLEASIAQVVTQVGRRRLRMLEIGAGTGGTTSAVLKRLPDTAEYLFTDISPVFLSRAQDKFRDHRFVRYRTFDVERDPRSQGLAPGSFDIILAAHVVHATADLRRTFAHVRDLLSPGGILVLLEGTQAVPWVDLVFGLTEGWWKSTDFDLRPRYPLLPPHGWRDVMAEAGFESIERASLADEDPLLWTSSSVFLARRGRASTPIAASAPGHWLVFADAGNVADRVADGLRANGAHCTLVRPSDSYSIGADGVASINSEMPEQVAQLIEEVGRRSPLTGVLYLWGLDSAHAQALTAGAIEVSLQSGLRTALNLAQVLKSRKEATPPKLWFCTRGAVALDDCDAVPGLLQSTLWGFGKVVALECPELWGGLIDLPDLPLDQSDVGAVVRRVQATDGEDLQALRGHVMHCPRVVEAPAPPVSAAMTYDPCATYLITGGLGSLGLKLATWMAQKGAGHIVLLGRQPPSLNARAVIGELRAAGCDVRAVQCDVCDREALQEVLGQIAATGHALHGLVHAAGVGSYTDIENLEFDTLKAEMRAKVTGAWLLHEMTRDLRLDFFVLYSSMVSLWGAKGQAAYVAANQFLDLLAHHRRSCGLPALSVDWGLWATSERTDLINQLAPAGVRTLRPREALEWLDRLMAAGTSQVAVADIDWPIFKSLYEARKRRHLFERIEVKSNAPAAARNSSLREELEQAPLGVRFDLLRTFIISELAAVIGLTPSQRPAGHQGFFDLGMDLLMAMEFASRLESCLACTLSPTMVFDNPTVDDLTRHIFTKVFGWTLETAKAEGLEIAQANLVPNFGEWSAEQIEDSIADELNQIEAMLHLLPDDPASSKE